MLKTETLKAWKAEAKFIKAPSPAREGAVGPSRTGVTREARVLLNQCEPESGAGEGLVGFSA